MCWKVLELMVSEHLSCSDAATWCGVGSTSCGDGWLCPAGGPAWVPWSSHCVLSGVMVSVYRAASIPGLGTHATVNGRFVFDWSVLELVERRSRWWLGLSRAPAVTACQCRQSLKGTSWPGENRYAWLSNVTLLEYSCCLMEGARAGEVHETVHTGHT